MKKVESMGDSFKTDAKNPIWSSYFPVDTL
jgi:hypothetical protein